MDPVKNFVSCVPRRFSHPLLLMGLLALEHASGSLPQLHAASPQMWFDASSQIGCRDVTPPDFVRSNPDEKLVEARFQVSSLLRRGSEEDLEQVLLQVASIRQTMRVVDYTPRTTLASELAGNLTVEEKVDQNAQLTAGLALPSVWNAKVTANGDLSKKRQQTQKCEFLPPMMPIASSGTLDRGYGVYFKLRPSRRTSLEGAKEFSIVFRVARTWRGDCVQLNCQATGTWRNAVPPISETRVCGARRFTIALYAEGDLAAKAAAERLVRAESELLRTVSSNRRELQKQLAPSLVQRLGVAEPLLPADWAEQLICDARPEPDGRLSQHLPTGVRQAVTEWSLAKRGLYSLGPGETSRVQ